MNRGTPVALGILAYCLWNARLLFIQWAEFSIRDFGLLAFIIWCFPIIIYWAGKPQNHIFQPVILAIALILSLIGTLGELAILQQFALAIALISFYPWSWAAGLYLIASISWFSSSGWLFSSLHLDFPGIRPLIAACWTTWLFRQKENEGTLP